MPARPGPADSRRGRRGQFWPCSPLSNLQLAHSLAMAALALAPAVLASRPRQAGPRAAATAAPAASSDGFATSGRLGEAAPLSSRLGGAPRVASGVYAARRSRRTAKQLAPCANFGSVEPHQQARIKARG